MDFPENSAKDDKTGGSSFAEKLRKIDSVKIDFDRDNILPGLNPEDLALLGKPDKPVLLKKNIIDKNEINHPDVSRNDTARMIGHALYNHDLITPGHGDYPYFNFLSRVGENQSTVCLLELLESKDNYEIINWHWVSGRTRGQIERSGEKIKSAKSKQEGQP